MLYVKMHGINIEPHLQLVPEFYLRHKLQVTLFVFGISDTLHIIV
jgi:hypothetical protein